VKVTPTALPDVLRVEPKVFGDARGYFFESYSARRYAEADLVIVATGSTKPVITMQHMQPSIDRPKFRVMIDLSVPRNIDPQIGRLDFVDVANMDMLSDVTGEAFRKRRKLVLDRLKEMEGVECYVPDGAFYVFPEVYKLYGKK
jgi:hypothetical protein